MGKVTFKRSGFGNNVYCVPCDTGIGYKFGMEGDYYPAANHEALEAELAGCRDFSEELKTQLEDVKTDAAKDYRDMRRFQENFINADQERIALRSRVAELEENELELQKTVTAFNEWLDTERRKVAELEAEVERLNTHAVEVYKEQRKAYLIQQAEMERLRKSDNVCGGHLLSDCE